MAKAVVKALNFKELYNKKYGDIARIGKTHSVTPEQLFDLAVRYFEWAEKNAIEASETASFQGGVYESLIHKPRIFTITGFRLFSGFSEAAIVKWRASPGFSEVMEFIDGVVSEQKFQLAANNIINASFIGKDIGIEKPDTINVEASASADISNVSVDEVKAAVRDILGEL